MIWGLLGQQAQRIHPEDGFWQQLLSRPRFLPQGFQRGFKHLLRRRPLAFLDQCTSAQGFGLRGINVAQQVPQVPQLPTMQQGFRQWIAQRRGHLGFPGLRHHPLKRG